MLCEDVIFYQMLISIQGFLRWNPRKIINYYSCILIIQYLIKLGKHARSYVVFIVIPDKIRFFLIKQYICLLYPNDYSRLRYVKKVYRENYLNSTLFY